MGFGDNTRPQGNADAGQSTGIGESIYIKLSGEQQIRILDKTEDVPFYWRYWMPVNVGGKTQDRSIVVGRSGPIAKFMASIGPEDRKFRKPQKRMLLNVLDRSDGKVKVLDFGADLLDKFTTLHQRVRSQETFEPLPIWEVDLQIISIAGKEPKDVKRNVFPAMENQGPLKGAEAELLKYDLSKVAQVMPDEMQQRLLDGEDLLEILKELNWQRPTPTVAQ